MASYDVLSLDEQTDLLVAAASNLLPDKNWARNSDNWKRLRVVAGAITDAHAHLSAVGRDSTPLTAKGEALDGWAEVVGITRKGATAASGTNAGKIRGTNGSTWTTSDVLLHKSGLRFQPTSGGTMGSSEEALVGIIAIDTGPETRLEKGEFLEWESTPTGLEDEVELVENLDAGGEAEEDEGAFRVRILARFAEPVRGGSVGDWEAWAVESADYIATAYVYPNRNGLGSVDVAALKTGSGAARLLSGGEIATLLAYLNTKRPVTASARVLTVATQTQSVEVTLVPESDKKWAQDWDDNVPPVVSTWNSTTRTLTFTGARPASMDVGHRIVVAGTSGVELVIESLVSTNAVVLVDAKGQTPVATSNVYSGGPLVTAVRDAILAFIDDLGPRVGDFGYGNWESAIRQSRLFETVQVVEGVLDSTLVTPSSTVDATAETFPDDATVNLLVPGNVIVRYA